MAVPKITETRGRDGSVQAKLMIQSLHKYPHPYIFSLLMHSTLCSTLIAEPCHVGHYRLCIKERYRNEVTCVAIVSSALPARCHPYT